MEGPQLTNLFDGSGYPDPEQSQGFVDNFFKMFNAWLSINAGGSGIPDQTVVTYDLTTARDEADPVVIPFAFRSVVVRDGSDNNAYLNLKPYSRDTQQGSSKIRNNTVWEAGELPVPRAYLWWPAQAGKTLTLEYHLRSKVTPGNTQQTAYVTEGSGVTSNAYKTVTTTAAVLLAANADRKVTVVQNQGSSSIYVGASDVTGPAGAKPGIEIASGRDFTWKNTGALYAITASGSNASIASMDEA